MAGYVDLYQSRRDLKEKAWWWSVDEKYKVVDEIMYKKECNGVFYCKEITATSTNSQQVGIGFQYENNNTTIFTRDNVEGMKNHDLICFRGKKWVVEQIQKKPVSRNLDYGNKPSYYYYIAIRSDDK